MAVSSWRTRHQNIRTGRLRPGRNKQDEVLVDLSQEPLVNIKDILRNLCDKDTPHARLINYLNGFVKVTLQIEGKFENHGYIIEEILLCLKLTLLNTSTKVRSGGLRCIRHVVKNEEDVNILNKLLIPYLITRSLDLIYKHDVERIEAMKLIRKILILSPLNFDSSMARSLVALANEGSESKDRLLRICLATLSELGVLNSKLFISCGGVAAITRNLLECQTPKIAESLCGVLLMMLDRPETRECASVDLHTLAAPFCDFHYKLRLKESKKYEVDERELRLNCSRMALLSVLRSWSGILHFCNPRDQTGFKAVVDVLYLDQLEVRKAVLDLLYELLGLPQPEWSDELSVALGAVDPCEPQASWRLNEGFVAAEGKSVLPHLSKTTPSLTEMHLSLLLYCFLENGLLGALSEVIATSDTFISVRATVLLGELLRLIQVLLPPDCCNVSPSLPLLLDYAVGNVPQAIGAVTALQQLHKLMKKRPASYSLYLDFILKSSTNSADSLKPNRPPSRQKLTSGLKSKIHQLQYVLRDNEDSVKDTGVLLSTDPFTWNWDLVGILLRGENNFKFDLLDPSHKNFIKRLSEFFMPSKNKYSHLDLSCVQQSNQYTQSGVQLIYFLMQMDDIDCKSLLMDLFKDILNNIEAITKGRTVHDCLFSPQHMQNTQCQSYFLFIGRFATTPPGDELLRSIDMFDKLENLATTTIHDCYVKLIVSSLDYSLPGSSRKILALTLTCNQENSRLYATQFLLTLLRAGVHQFSVWGMEMLVNQLKDKSKAVYLAAMNALHEACELPECLDTLIKLNPSLDIENERDMLLMIRFLSNKIGLAQITKDEKVLQLIKHWDNDFVYRYVKMTEGDIADALTLHQRGLDGKYDKRTSSIRSMNQKEVFLPPHLYGQLNQQKEGLQVLLEQGNCKNMIKIIMDADCSTEDQTLKLKAAIWSMGHLATSNAGLIDINSKGVIDAIIDLAQSCPVYSIRATAFFSLGIVATTKMGADQLFQKGWICTRHHRHDFWPIIEDEIESIVRRHHNISMSEEGSISMDNPFTYEFESIDEDTGEDSFSIIESPEIRRTSSMMKQSTLPSGRRPYYGHHKRSHSESKTFEMNGFSEDRFKFPYDSIRLRNHSITESTTSGVSSCDSLQGIKATTNITEHTQKLSPIPSSSSLSTLQQQANRPPPRSHKNSESSHRMSSQSDTNSDISSFSNYISSNRLTYQDLVGYTTLRHLRNSTEEFDGQSRDTQPISNFIIHNNPSLLEDFKMMDISFKSVFSVQKFPLNSSHSKHDDKIYMGISLPQVLGVLFPDLKDVNTFSLAGFEETAGGVEELSVHSSSDSQTSKHQNKLMVHTLEKCLSCSRLHENKFASLADKPDSFDVLCNIERLANPVWNKHVKQYLLQCRHKDLAILKDVCMYSEVCKMMSESSYRVSSRRILHELFLDLNLNSIYEECQIKLQNKGELKRNSLPQGDSINGNSSLLQNPPVTLAIGSASVSSIIHTSPTLDSLKFIYKENKFPIRENK
ncbi:unnamed protein product [Brassicogethes aeneus]|uniref:Rapamycin-insensitive companion of mTOR n=1 Tax=Brassicogethes aeneus TaxID=1431903 RepID=A0A9P0FII4_BRAAE|nr:unnamed protein product [Brassicogethes aeneus]